MAAVNRQTARDQLASLLNTALVGSGLPAAAVYGYLIGDFQNQMPVVVVGSAGSERKRVYLGTSVWETWFYYTVYAFVLYADASASWDENDAEDRVDLIEKTICDVLMTNKTLAGYWDSIEFAGRSEITTYEEGGKAYRVETFPVKVRVING